jgi:hypothetical protein
MAIPLALLLVFVSAPAFAKVICPPGEYVLRVDTASRMATLDGRRLHLGDGQLGIDDACRTNAVEGFHRRTGVWLLGVRGRWRRCDGRQLRLRARFDLHTAFCMRLVGTLRAGGGARSSFVAERVPACGNRLREPGEQCDAGPDGGPCCRSDCRAESGCDVSCDARGEFPCDADRVCVHTCGGGGVCRLRDWIRCDEGPVCDCSGQTTYADRCAAYAAGTGVSREGPCDAP